MMKNLFSVLIIIGFYSSFLIIPWFIREITKFIETRKYKAKLKKITPQIEAINTEELSSELISAKESYLSLGGLLQGRYGICGEDEQKKDISTYTEEEANYRRKIRKPSEETHRRRYRQYRRYY
jgi:hypothetical protein